MAERDRANSNLQAERERQNALTAAGAARECADREARLLAEHRGAIGNDQRTIMTTLGLVNSSEGGVHGAVGVTIESLDASGWRWVTAAVGSDGTAQVVGRVNFSVNPALLSTSVELVPGSDSTGVRFRCSSGNCIRAIGRVTAEAEGQSETQDVDRFVPNAVWVLDTANRAQVVRDALSGLIGRLSNPPRTGTCSPTPAPAAVQ